MRTIHVAAIAAAAVALGAVPRILVAADALPSWLRPFVWSDVLHLWERGLRDGALPYRDAFFEYPPLTAAVWAAIDAATASAVAHVALWAAVQAGCAALVAAMLARRAGARRAVILWSASPQLVLYGSVNVETLALAPLVAALVLAAAGRAGSPAALLAAGSAVKLFPAAALPVLLARLDARRAAMAAAVFTAAIVATFAPAVAVSPSALGPLERYSLGVTPNVDSPWGIAQSALRAVSEDAAAALAAISLAGMLATYVLFVLPAARRARDIAAPAALAVLTVLIWSRLLSPQYALWVLPFLALTAAPTRLYVAFTAADVAVFFTVYPLTLVRWPPGDPAALALTAVLAAAVVVRHAALIAFARHAWSTAQGSRSAQASISPT